MNREWWRCPICERETRKNPALSRKDNKTLICPDCGVNEALSDFMKSIDSKKKRKWL